MDSITSDFLPMLINPLDDLVEPFSSGLESKVEEDLNPPRPTEDEELGEIHQEAPPETQTTTEVQQPLEVQHDILELQPVPPPVPQPEPEHERAIVDQAFASQGIELPPLPDSSASDEQDQEEEHSEEPIHQEAPPETQTTTEVQQPLEVQHDILELQPVPPPVPQPEPEHEPQPGAIVDPHPEL
ncbi:protein TsetseEP-like [Arachis ipaensis]|uniref:protein TsetseEP-like n=1 Tax=Arachis ipaensis TaxID=130454 RepID=UPI0007AFC77E|nr:protein TsetseEP-like [Arachis ipaensis]